jgi:hypothetical protein
MPHQNVEKEATAMQDGDGMRLSAFGVPSLATSLSNHFFKMLYPTLKPKDVCSTMR